MCYKNLKASLFQHIKKRKKKEKKSKNIDYLGKKAKIFQQFQKHT